MLTHLSVKNVALIETAEIDFSNGLNILSGETGAGKSMVIDSLGFLLGQKAGKDFIRQGESEAVVSAVFSVENEAVLSLVKGLGIDVADDNSLMILRTLSLNGRSTVKINAKTVTVSVLKEVASMLVDIHSQHEHQSLLNANKHIEMLDRFCPAEITELKTKLNEYLKEYRELSKQAKEISAKRGDNGDRHEFIAFQINEIESAKLRENEEEQLKNRYNILQKSEELRQQADTARAYLFSESGEGGNTLALVNSALKSLGEALEVDSRVKDIHDALESISIELEDMRGDLSRYIDDIENNSDELLETEERLELIYSLKRKYGGTVKDILKFRDNLKKEYEFIENGSELLKKLNIRRRNLNKHIMDICSEIHEKRSAEAFKIAKAIEGILRELGMKDAVFEISVAEKPEIGPNGNDKVLFLISPNPGEPVKELAKIASGGEMSRVMLSLKTVMADADGIETYIFDEIDSGVSGRTAQKVAEKLNLVSSKQQILCITHLPQIAAMADNHLLIEKTVRGNKTITGVNPLDYEGMVDEIGRLLGGHVITETTLANARELKDMAMELKGNAR
ncbi:MAG: DNA repair protein RecN [Clostridiales bacterium]|jgi:DNA repair protein RecN (Recombination protein N)|nr:DNA repair protein RecN [Clostridiales bacterium]